MRIHDFDAISDTPMLRPEVQQVLALLPARIRADLLPLITLCQSERPMAIHGWQDRSSVAAGLAGLLTDIPRIVMSARNMEPAKRADPNLPMLRGLYRTLCAMPQVTLTVNSEAGARGYEDWLDLGRNQAKVIHNAIDGAAFPLLPQANDAQPAPLRILGVFRFAANKRPELWLRTIAALRAKSSRPIQARLVGSGPFLDRIIELCNELGLHDIEIAQNLSRPDEIYCEADILLLMSRVEGTPNVVLEEQCSGLAVTACDVGGVREALHDDGLTLPSEIGPDMAADLILDAGEIRAAIGSLVPVQRAAAVPTEPLANETFSAARERFDRQLIQSTLAQCAGKVPEAAVRLGLGRSTLYKKMAALGIAESPY